MSHHSIDEPRGSTSAAPPMGAAGSLWRVWTGLNHVVTTVSAIALVIAAAVLTYSVVTRYFLHYSTDWQDEFSVFLIVGAVFMSAASVQARRGHVSIEAFAVLLPKNIDRVRLLLVDCAGCLFCSFFSWKSWTLLHEAIVDNFHSSSTWGPPLWIPYSLMTLGMVLLSVQLLIQVVDGCRRWSSIR